MKKNSLLLLTVVIVAGACVLPAIPLPNAATPIPSATLDAAGTEAALQQTAAALTGTSQPTVTDVIAVATETPSATVEASPTLAVTETPSPTTTSTPDIALTAMTATIGPTNTATLAVGNPVTLTPTFTILLWGTLPPAVRSSDIRLVNRSKTEAYISLQVTSPEGGYAVLEYPVAGTLDIKAPVGSYLYVAWVGGRQMVGNFRLHGNEALTIILYRDRIEVK